MESIPQKNAWVLEVNNMWIGSSHNIAVHIVAATTSTPNAIPIADNSGKIDISWIPLLPPGINGYATALMLMGA